MREQRVGTVVEYWPLAGMARVELDASGLCRGDVVRIKGVERDFVQEVEALRPVARVRRRVRRARGDVVLQVMEPVRVGDEVWRLDQGPSWSPGPAAAPSRALVPRPARRHSRRQAW